MAFMGAGQDLDQIATERLANREQQRERQKQLDLARFVNPQDNRFLREVWILASLLIVVLGVSVGEIVIALVGAAIFVAGWLARLWGRLSLQRLELTQTLSDSHAFVGERVELEIAVANRKLLPLPWLELRTEMPELLVPDNRRLEPSGLPKIDYLLRRTGMRWYERIRWSYPIPLKARGYYRFGATRLRAGDLFGFFTRQRTTTNDLRLWVYPETVPLDRLEIPLYRPYGEHKGGNPLFDDATRLQGLREYRAGDAMKRVDWKATARHGQLRSRVYDPSSDPEVVLALNVTTVPEPFLGFVGEVFERAVSVAASLATAYHEERIPFGLLSNCSLPEEDATVKVPSGRSPAQLTRVLEALAMVDVFTLVPMAALLDEEARRLPMGSTVVLVSGLATPPVMDAMGRLRRRGYRPVLIYVGLDDPPALVDFPVHDLRQALADVHFTRAEFGYAWSLEESEFRRRESGVRGSGGGEDADDAADAAPEGDRPTGAVVSASSALGDPWARPRVDQGEPEA